VTFARWFVARSAFIPIVFVISAHYWFTEAILTLLLWPAKC
jgi:hypothetical protein